MTGEYEMRKQAIQGMALLLAIGLPVAAAWADMIATRPPGEFYHRESWFDLVLLIPLLAGYLLYKRYRKGDS